MYSFRVRDCLQKSELAVVDIVRVSESYLPLPSKCVTQNSTVKVVVTGFRVQWNAACNFTREKRRRTLQTRATRE